MSESELFVDDNLRSWYVIYKVVVCLFFWSSIIYSWVDTNSGSTYLVFMTNWGICFLCPTILLETVIVLMISSNLTPPSAVMLGNLTLTFSRPSLPQDPPSRHGPHLRLLHVRPLYLHPLLVPLVRLHQSPLLYRPLCSRTTGERPGVNIYTLTSTSGNFCSS